MNNKNKLKTDITFDTFTANLLKTKQYFQNKVKKMEWLKTVLEQWQSNSVVSQIFLSPLESV